MYIPFFLPNHYLLSRQISQRISTCLKIIYRSFLLLVFILAVAVSAVPVQVGVVYQDVIQELGKPDGKLVIGNKQILTYGDAEVAIRDKNVISVSPEFNHLLRERANKLNVIQTMREANLIHYRGQWVTPEEKERIIQAEKDKRNSNVTQLIDKQIWLTEFEKASELARSQNKELLLHFTGSD